MNNNSNTIILKEFKSLYETKKYEDALTILHENKPMFDPGVYEFNIGLIYIKQEHYTLARINLERAKEYGFMNNELNSALDEVKNFLDVTRLEENVSASDNINEILFDLPKEIFFSISVLLIIIFILYYKKIQSVAIRIASLVIIIFPIVFYFTVVSGKSEVVLLEELPVRRGPSEMFEEVQVVPKGMKVFINDQIGGWNLIVHPKSHQGWIKTEKVEKI